MALIDHVYLDAGLTDQFDDSTDTLDCFAIDGETGDGSFWVGSDDSGIKIQEATDPGVNNLTLTIADSGSGTGVDELDIKLALSQAGLDSAVAGDPLSLGATITGGAGNAVRVWYRWDNSVGSGTYTEISLTLSARVEVVI